MSKKLCAACALLFFLAVLISCGPIIDIPSGSSAQQKEFMQVVPLRSVYSLGDTFTPVTGIGVYRSTAAGILEPVPPSSWISVTITPDSKMPVDAVGGYQFNDLGNHIVKVEALDMTGTYDLWVSVQGHKQTMAITYVDGTTGTMEQQANGEWTVAAPRDEVIYSFTTVNTPTGDPGWTYLMGRKDTDTVPIKLNISPTGRLDFHPPSAQAQHRTYTPVGTVAEMRNHCLVIGTLINLSLELQAVMMARTFLTAMLMAPETIIRQRPILIVSPTSAPFPAGKPALTV